MMAFLMKDTDVASIYTTWCCQGKNESPKTSVSFIFLLDFYVSYA